MTWPALNSVFLKHKKTWRPCRRMHRLTPLNHCLLITGKLGNIYLKSSPFRFRSLTNSSGATNIWKKVSRRRLKRLVEGSFAGMYSTWTFYYTSHLKKQKKPQTLPCPEDHVYVFALPQLLLFLKGFTESERNKLAMLTGILLANGNISAAILSSLFNENLVKEGTCFSAS